MRATIADMDASNPTDETRDPGRRSRRGRPPRSGPEELVLAAMTVIGRDGVGAATTRKIAEEAGVPLGTVHYWFKDKSELLEEVVREMLRRIERATEGFRLGANPRMKDALLAAFREIAEDDLGAQLGIYELTALAIRTPGMHELASRQYGLYRETALRAIEPLIAGEIHDAAEGRAIAELVAVTFDGMILAWLADPAGSNPEAVFRLLAELLEARLAPSELSRNPVSALSER
jgi:AcrR family transcriptional regulator